jgi:serine/threonine-protein kinase RsbW
VGDHQLVFTSPPDDVNTVHDFLTSVWRDDDTVTEEERMAFELALVELTSNVIEHAAAGEGVACRLDVTIADGELTAMLSDTAEPGEVSLVGRTMPDQMAEGGRGLALVQMLVDELGYGRVDGTNVWTVKKARSAS